MSWRDIPGWFNFDDIYDEAIERSEDGDVLVEVGVAFGRSIAYLARKAIDSKKNLRIYGIDPWIDDWKPGEYDPHNGRPTWGAEHADWARSLGGPFNAFCYAMHTHAPEELEYITVLRTTSTLASDLIMHPCRMVFLDGNHNYDAVLDDLNSWMYHVVRGGILAGHDYTPDFPGVQQAVHETLGDVPRRRDSFFLEVR